MAFATRTMSIILMGAVAIGVAGCKRDDRARNATHNEMESNNAGRPAASATNEAQSTAGTPYVIPAAPLPGRTGNEMQGDVVGNQARPQ